MARIVIRDLKESVELDRAAMRRIAGGRGHQRFSGAATLQPSVLHKNALLEQLNLSGFGFDSNRW